MEHKLSKYKEDSELVARAKNGDLAAFEEIVNKYKSLMAKVIIGMVGNREDAEDIGQEAFIRFYNSMHQYHAEASLSTYLTRIAINLSLNELKKRQSKKWLSLESKHEQFHADNDTSRQRDEKEIVEKALEQLETKYKSVVVLRLIQGFSTKETAKILKLPLGTVLSRLARGQEKLKEIITEMER
ncbi:MAG: sigma-70 family RNA polymerase sigma factor [Bacteroidales bacterium]|nr:sigma-70 family RNA polymerase sigma factor [Bacteroidales bacterium]